MGLKRQEITQPDIIPIFPLTGVLLLPGGQLPLHIFEPQYLAMVQDVLTTPSRLVGIIQPDYKIGCAGRVTGFQELCDSRFDITLTGTSRFYLSQETDRCNGYRQGKVSWGDYVNDLAWKVQDKDCFDFDRERLYQSLHMFFEYHDMSCCWDMVRSTPDYKLITVLSMICPLEPREKQCLLEAGDCKERAEKFMTMIELAVR